MSLTDESNTRNLRDFLMLYNQLTEQCFDRCILNFNRTNVSSAEDVCVHLCAERYVAFNQKQMHIFMEHQNQKQQTAMQAATANLGTLPTPGIVPS